MAFPDNPLINWQKNLKNWQDRISHIKENTNLADFKFIVGPEKTVFHAHKLVFAISSPEFENLFYLLGSDMKEINLPNNSPIIFQQLLDYVYTGKIEVTLENVAEILKLAELYQITLLTNECQTVLEEDAKKDNVLSLLEITNEYELPILETKCLNVITQYAEKIFDDPVFYNISQSSLKKIVEFEELSIEEIKIYKALDKWSEVACKNVQMKATSENKRIFLGDIVLKIKFEYMSLEEFGKCSSGNTPLTNEEIVRIFRSLTKSNNSTIKRRVGQLNRCIRFTNGPARDTYCNSGGASSFTITVDRSIYLCGYGVYGVKDESLHECPQENVEIELQNVFGKVLAKHTESLISDGSEQIYEIFFEKPILVEAFKEYHVIVQKESFSKKYLSFRGGNGKTNILENGVTFTLTGDDQQSFEGFTASIIFKN